MKKIWIIAALWMLALTSACATASSISWNNYSPKVFEQAKKAKHTVMLFAMSDTCHWCQQMESTTFKDPGIVKMINDHFYPVILHADKEPETTSKLQLEGVPTIIFFDADGGVKKTYSGYKQTADMIQMLADMSPMQTSN